MAQKGALTQLFEDFLGTILMWGIGIGLAGMGAIWGISKLVTLDETVIGVKLTQNQQNLRKKGLVCDEYLTQAFAQAKQQNKVVDLKLPPNPGQNCPKP